VIMSRREIENGTHSYRVQANEERLEQEQKSALYERENFAQTTSDVTVTDSVTGHTH
jgi:hypothetical protein